MATLESRLRLLEQSSRQTEPLVIYAPDGEVPVELAEMVAEAGQAGRAVVLAGRHDAEF